MAPGNAWHIPGDVEPFLGLTMRNPVFPTDLRNPVTIFSGNQFAGDGGANQLRVGSFVSYKRSIDTIWKTAQMEFRGENANNKYFYADIPLTGYAARDQVQYYLVLAYSERDTTFLGATEDEPSGWYSGRLATEAVARARPFTFTIGTKNEQEPFAYLSGGPKVRGQWGKVFDLPSVGAHAHLLNTGKVLMWGRRDTLEQSLNTFPATTLFPDSPQVKATPPATCTPFILDPSTLTCKRTRQPFMPDGIRVNANLPKTNDGKANVNLFCSGHAFQSDGKLFVAGGHFIDAQGIDQACIYDPEKDTWEAVTTGKNGGAAKDAVMGNGRWYPTVLALPTGTVLVTSGSYGETVGDRDARIINNYDTQILSPAGFASIQQEPDGPFDLYPRLHVASSGIVYWISRSEIRYLDQANSKRWQTLSLAERSKNKRNPPQRVQREYAPSVMYDKDKVIYMGGGRPPSAITEVLDLSDPNPNNVEFKRSDNMLFSRRQHNATVLPDGTVLVTGGTRGNGDGATLFREDVGFNDLRPGRPVHVPELWNPKDGKWTPMAAEQIDRCYHATAVLLPDGRVLSAGGGEFQLGGRYPNDKLDSQCNAQVFSPPYLFQDGPRPKIDSVSKKVIECGPTSTFEVGTAEPAKIDKISLIGLSSVTHSINTSQRLMFLDFKRNQRSLTVNAPLNAKSCPPGYYMIFLVSASGVPSVARFVQIVASPSAMARHVGYTSSIMAEEIKPQTIRDRREEVRKAANGTRIEIGITATCPYGLSACWGGAFEALSKLTGVEHVDPIPHSTGSTASVFLLDNGLPDLDLWTRQFKGLVRESYGLRGYEAAVVGTVEMRDNGVVLVAGEARPEVHLTPLGSGSKVQWDRFTRRPHAVTREEAAAYEKVARLASLGNTRLVTITGPLGVTESGYQIQVRLVST